MAKSKLTIFLLTLALVAASSNSKHGGALASADDDDDLPQRQEAMAEAVRVINNYDPARDAAETVQRAIRVMNGEVALLRPIFIAISKMPERSAAEARAKEEAHAAARELLARHFRHLLPGRSVTVKMEEL